jgi:hypothetical protein
VDHTGSRDQHDVMILKQPPITVIIPNRHGRQAEAAPTRAAQAASPTALAMTRALTRCAGDTGSLYSRPRQFSTCTTVVTVATGRSPVDPKPLCTDTPPPVGGPGPPGVPRQSIQRGVLAATGKN